MMGLPLGSLVGNTFGAQGTQGAQNTMASLQAALVGDPVNAPNHYCRHKTTGVQIVHDWGLDFYLGSAIMYIERYDMKGGVEDLKKARKYLDMKIELMEKGELKETIRHG